MESKEVAPDICWRRAELQDSPEKLDLLLADGTGGMKGRKLWFPKNLGD